MPLKQAEIKSLLLVHVRPANFEAAEAAHFNNLAREPDQDVQSFMIQLQIGEEKCHFGDQLEIKLRNHFYSRHKPPRNKTKP